MELCATQTKKKQASKQKNENIVHQEKKGIYKSHSLNFSIPNGARQKKKKNFIV